MPGCSPIFQPCWHVPVLAGCHSLPPLVFKQPPPRLQHQLVGNRTERGERGCRTVPHRAAGELLG